ncbi:MAG: nicotinate-nucleotide diphosphorylase (carboxylating), partial [Halobacteria archaeon]|nr:nicotinate-nucleotide diphosphorylase (carboxylating) [Halobacteria archaeon]
DDEAEAEIITKDDGVVAGIEEAHMVFSRLGVETLPEFKDGSPVRRGEVVLTARGRADALVRAERLALNLLG